MNRIKLAKELIKVAKFLIGTKISDKDWKRMRDLVVTGKDGANVARSIKSKDKAIARFVAGLLLEGDKPETSSFRDNEYNCAFDDFGNKALELGATKDEIEKIFKATKVPEKYETQLKDTGRGNGSYTGPILKTILGMGFKVKTLKSGGNAKTGIGKEAMGRNGRNWTMGYELEINLGTSKEELHFDAITDEGGRRPTMFVFDGRGSSRIFDFPPYEMGIRDFTANLKKSLEKATEMDKVASLSNELVLIAKSLMGAEERDINEDIKTIDFNQLAKLISQKIGTSVKLKISIGGRKDTIRIVSQDLKDKTGILSGFYREFQVDNFGGGYTTDGKHYWMPVHFSWKYQDGGTNGTSVEDYFWDFAKGKWIIK